MDSFCNCNLHGRRRGVSNAGLLQVILYLLFVESKALAPRPCMSKQAPSSNLLNRSHETTQLIECRFLASVWYCSHLWFWRIFLTFEVNAATIVWSSGLQFGVTCICLGTTCLAISTICQSLSPAPKPSQFHNTFIFDEPRQRYGKGHA